MDFQPLSLNRKNINRFLVFSSKTAAMKALFTIILLLFISLTLPAQDIDREKLDAFFDLIATENQGMGSVSLFRDGEEIYQRSIGYERAETSEAAGPVTAYRIGSISKVFTSAIILRLTEEDKLSLNTTLSEFYPEMPNADRITIEHLLRHQSGLHNFTNAPEYPTYMEMSKSRKELLDIFAEGGTEFEPGEKYQYSNTNYVLLSFIAEEVSGNDFETLLDTQIAGPCGLEHTYYGGRIGDRQNEAFSYTFGEEWTPSTETDMSIPQGAGAIVSTATDINRFLTCLFAGEIVPENLLKEMITIEMGYGLGIIQYPFGEKKAFGHSGGIDAFQSMAGYFPEENISIAYLANGVVYPVNSIMIGTLSIAFDTPFEFPVFVKSDTAVLETFIGTYTSPQLPIDLKIFREGARLFGQGTGQPAFPLTPVDDNTFKFDQAGLSVEFIPEENKLMLTQGGGTFEMIRQEE